MQYSEFNSCTAIKETVLFLDGFMAFMSLGKKFLLGKFLFMSWGNLQLLNHHFQKNGWQLVNSKQGNRVVAHRQAGGLLLE